ncbi:MAG: YkgJ family cysteine cluster protein [Deltaproteobacteria bacterium]|nr:YkgJ family cysteine cluster protein [Deltaproteobacteria bacterium]
MTGDRPIGNDALLKIWITAVEQIGLPVSLADTSAVTIFHQLCHALIERSEWRACSTGPREVAALRVQYVLARRHGLRELLTPAESPWSGDVLADRSDPSVRDALGGLRSAVWESWAPALHAALVATAQLAGVETPPLHPGGFAFGEASGNCGTCAWRGVSGDRIVCQQAEGVVEDQWPTCERYEPALDCQDCGACCREAFHIVPVNADDPAVQRLPLLVVADGGRFEVLRDGDRCAALSGGNGERYRCTVYADRPVTCRHFTAGTSSCLLARQRVGMSA